ncbi:MAG: CDP-2,3-bis-(O-geranylgeranyl)-sn-glycerol synthase [Candidatus Bathyarchaeia archaeon]
MEPIDLVKTVYFIIPAYLANSTPVIFGGKGTPVDLGKKFIDNERIFGKNKTIRGLMSGILFGSIAGLIIELILLEDGFTKIGFLISLGAMIGDLAGSFIKRRFKIPPGHSFLPIDQLDFIFGALIFALPLYRLSLEAIILIILITFPTHILANLLANTLKLKPTFL